MISKKTAFSTLLYLPSSSEFDHPAAAGRRAGARVVWNGERGELDAADVVRVGLLDALPQSAHTVLLAGDHSLDLPEMARRIEVLRAREVTVWAEVISAEMGGLCEEGGVQALVACGFEGPGVVGEESSLVLLRRLLETSSLPVFVRGGIGADAAAAVVAIGAAGYVLEHQLWLCDEYPTGSALRARLEKFNPTDTRCVGMQLGLRFRAFALIATRPVKTLVEREVELMANGASGRDFYEELDGARASQPWNLDVREHLWPLGQEAGLAAPLKARFETLEGIIKGIADHVDDVLSSIDDDFPLAAGRGIAEVNGTRLPIHQGPMAQVSDTPAFAKAVAEAGAMPWLALGNMPLHVAEDVVDGTARATGLLPYGAGIIGLDANPYRDGHIEMLKRRHGQAPVFGLVAAGTAEQAMQLESSSIPTYLHTPTPGILNAALKSGQTRFVLEGSEAGGHVGTLGSLALWQFAVLEVEAAIADGLDPTTISVVAAGGIGDAAGAAAAAALFFGLHRRGVNFGIQMGTAYLMTREAVTTGAVSQMYQTTAHQAHGTVIMGESVGAPTRVLQSDGARDVLAKEKERLATQVDLKERKHLYEEDNLGGLRAAAKAQRIARIDADRGAIFESLTPEEQSKVGLFHCGQGVVFCAADYGIDDLHQAVTDGARQLITERIQPPPEKKVMPGSTPCPQIIDGDQAIAIIGVGARMPGALSAPAFWRNIKTGVYSIGEVPVERWNPAFYWDPDPRAPDKTYSKIGGWITGFEFDRKGFRLPPAVVASMDPTQLLCLEAVREALDDAGYLERDFDRSRCAVILGNALGGDLRDTTNMRILFPELAQALRGAMMELSTGRLEAGDQERLLNLVEDRFKRDIPSITEDSMAGELANIVAGRVAQTFDLHGPNFITDAACASSLAAIDAAVRGLRNRQFDMVVTGGADCAMGPTSFVKFSKIGALSPDGSRPFDAGANGFVMGEGAGALIMKRLSDALRDGDEIYALIRGVGGSSDGRGKAITAPNPDGQKRAVRRAFQDAGFGPRTISLLEAHGTSTPVGDPVE
ncbi:MAG: beta-ketoacyl synthase N-terminal-like domain-containing protein, partial [Bradymonadaceae bacterium]